MSCRILYLSVASDWRREGQWLAGRAMPEGQVENAVRAMLDAVRQRGDAALVDYTRQFDCPDFAAPLRVAPDALEAAAGTIPAGHRAHIQEAAANIRAFHESQKEHSWFKTLPDGSILGQRVLPVDAVGLYVPGGQGGNTPLISTLLMNAIPAQVAGVARMAVCTPPRKDGTVNEYILAAAHLLGIDEVYRVGGAWSIAALAFGTESIAPVDVIAGPGNIYVTTAKRLVQGTVGIDMIAGPSEVLAIADESANVSWLAADLLSQAEHDPLAAAICVTNDAALAQRLCAELDRQCELLPRAAIAAKALADWGAIVVVPGMDEALAVANMIAPEHLELAVADPWALMPHIRHAGAIFMGHHCPEAVGDYFAGPNHVLPTLGTARFSSALSVQTFCKKSSIIATQPHFLQAHGEAIASLARLEGLEAHARSAEQRLS